MPLLDVELVLRPGESLSKDFAAEIADCAGEVFGSPPRWTWVKVRVIPTEHYAENGGAADGVHPVFVSVLKGRHPPPEEMQAEVTRLTNAIAQACARPPENVHVLYVPEGAGRVAFGGQLIST